MQHRSLQASAGAVLGTEGLESGRPRHVGQQSKAVRAGRRKLLAVIMAAISCLCAMRMMLLHYALPNRVDISPGSSVRSGLAVVDPAGQLTPTLVPGLLLPSHLPAASTPTLPPPSSAPPLETRSTPPEVDGGDNISAQEDAAASAQCAVRRTRRALHPAAPSRRRKTQLRMRAQTRAAPGTHTYR